MSKHVLHPINPAIMDLPIWLEIREYILPLKNSAKSRGSMKAYNMPAALVRRALKILVPCGNPGCTNKIHIIVKHPNTKGDVWSIHPTGPRLDGHKNCGYLRIVQAQILAMQLNIGQSENSPRIRRSKANGAQQLFKIVERKGRPELVL